MPIIVKFYGFIVKFLKIIVKLLPLYGNNNTKKLLDKTFIV